MTSEAWNLWFFQRVLPSGKVNVPGVDFLDGCPGRVAQKFDAILHSVIEAPPPQFAGGGHWEAMHGLMRGIYEARTRARTRG